MLERLGPYVIDKEIGRGGMGFVYSATHQESGDRVAVKMLSMHLLTTPIFDASTGNRNT